MLFKTSKCFLRSPNIVSVYFQRSRPYSHSLFSRKNGYITRQPLNFQPVRHISQEWDYDVEQVLKDDKYVEFSNKIFGLSLDGCNVFVIQPYIRHQHQTETQNTTPQLQLEEAVSLVKTLQRWKVADAKVVGVSSFKKSSFFGPTQIEKMKEEVRQLKSVSAIFVSVNILRVRQIIELENIFHMPVLDRYNIVIKIFRQHATTPEAKLQVAMAEIPYLRQCIKGIPKGLSDRLDSGGIIGGTGLVLTETRRELLNDREAKLKKALELLRKHRERLRSNQKKNWYPTVAVVGYTNAGKTSFIKALTGADHLTPRDQLFATLDVTKHEGKLPCNLSVLYVDTVGFITDIPTGLIESFTATLEDAIYSDVIVHVWDASNPDFLKQKEHVMKTLKSFNFEGDLGKKIIVVANKVDKITSNELLEWQQAESETYFVSTKTGYGMEESLHALQQKIIEVTGRRRLKIRVKTGGKEYEWLRKELPVEKMELESDSEHTVLTVISSEAQLDIFKHKFIKQKRL